MCSCTHPKPCCFLFSRIAGSVGSCVNFCEISLLTISLKTNKKKNMRLLWDGICMGADLSHRAPLFYYKRRRCTDRLYWMCQAELRTYCMCNFSWVFILMHLNFDRRLCIEAWQKKGVVGFVYSFLHFFTSTSLVLCVVLILAVTSFLFA